MSMLGDITEGLYEGLLPSYAGRKQKRRNEADIVESSRILSQMGQSAKPARGVEGTPGYIPAQEATGVYVGMSPEEVVQAEYLQKTLAVSSSPTALKWAMAQRGDQMNTRATGSNQRMLAREKNRMAGPAKGTSAMQNFAATRDPETGAEFSQFLDEDANRKRQRIVNTTNVFGPKLEYEKDKLMAKSNQAAYDARIKERNTLKQSAISTREMAQLAEQTYTGQGANIIQDISEFANIFGIEIPYMSKNASAGTQMRKLSKQLALKLAEDLKGSMSEKDLKFVIDGTQNITDPKQLFPYLEKRMNMLANYKDKVIQYMGNDLSDDSLRRAESRLKDEGMELFARKPKTPKKQELTDVQKAYQRFKKGK